MKTRLIPILLALVLACGGLLVAIPVSFTTAQEKARASRVKWEYYQFEWSENDNIRAASGTEGELRKLGNQGWELVSVSRTPRIPVINRINAADGTVEWEYDIPRTTYYFKRQKE